MLFDFIIHRLDAIATKRADFRLTRLMLWLAPATLVPTEMSTAIRCGTEQKPISLLSGIDRDGSLEEPRAFSGDHGAFIVNRGFAGA